MSQLEREIAEIPERSTAVAPVNRVALAEALARYRATPPPALFTIARGSSDAVAAYATYRLTPALNIPSVLSHLRSPVSIASGRMAGDSGRSPYRNRGRARIW